MKTRRTFVLSALIVAAGAGATARAGDSYGFVSDQPNYQAQPGATIDVTLYLHEQLGAGDSSRIAAEGGLFSVGLRVARSASSGASDPAVLNALGPDASFDGSVLLNVAGDAASLYEDHLSASGPGAEPDGNGFVRLGVMHVVAGAIGGQTTSFQIADDDPLTSNTITYAFSALDDSPGEFSIMVIPEPAALALIAAAASLAVSRRTRSARKTPR